MSGLTGLNRTIAQAILHSSWGNTDEVCRLRVNIICPSSVDSTVNITIIALVLGNNGISLFNNCIFYHFQLMS